MFLQERAHTRFSLLARFLMSAIFVLSGMDKLAAPAGSQAYIASAGIPLPALSYGLAVFIEVFFGLSLLIGFKARLAAAVLCAFTLLSGLIFHHDLADQNQFIHLMKNLCMAGGLLQVVCFGAGSLSVDSWFGPSPDAPPYFY